MLRINDGLLRPANNNLTLARLILASSVIYTHSCKQISGVDADDLTPLLGSPVSHYAVDGFFMLSGFLVYRSLAKNASIAAFIRARLTRLLPGMALMVLLTVVTGAFFTAVPVRDYLLGNATLKYIFYNLSFIFPAYHLTGIECGGTQCAVNESLWTLPWEVRCYLALCLFALLGLIRREAMLRLILPATFVFAFGWAAAAASVDLPAMLGAGPHYYLATAARLWPAFALGILVYELRDRIPLAWTICAVLLAANVAVQRFAPAFGISARQIFVAYFVLCLGFLSARRFAISAKWPDYSYGMYIYGFPVMLLFAAVVPIANAHLLALASIALTLPFAAISWHLVEKPALDWLRRRQHTAFVAADASRAAPAT